MGELVFVILKKGKDTFIKSEGMRACLLRDATLTSELSCPNNHP